jgi:antitoxin component YwqK of YwqJK toxin-antitoxin module
MYKEIIEAYPSGDTQAVHVFYKAEQGNSLYGFQSYYPDGNVKVQGCLRSPKIRVGVWESFYQNGKPWSIGTYDTAGVQTGIKRVWYENGQVRYQGQMENGKPAGEWEYFDENGKKKQ